MGHRIGYTVLEGRALGLPERGRRVVRDGLAIQLFHEGEKSVAVFERNGRTCVLAGKVLGLLFLNPSLRTLASFQSAMLRLGGAAVVITPGQGTWQMETRMGAIMNGGAAEHVREAVPVLASYCDAIGIRMFAEGRNLAADPVNQINRFAVGNVMPDLTIVLDVPTAVSLQRIRQRASDVPDRMERENIDFYEKIRSGYLLLAQSMPDRIVVVDGTLKEDQIARKILAAVKKVLR